MSDEQTLGARALSVRKEAGKTQIEMAKFLGVSTATWQKIERNEGIPAGETLLLFEKLGINPGWLLSGLGPQRMNEAPASANLIDIVLHQKLGAIVDQEHRAARINMQMEVFAAEVGKAYNHLVGLVSDLSDAEAVGEALPLVRRRVRQQLADAASNPGTGKREAS